MRPVVTESAPASVGRRVAARRTSLGYPQEVVATRAGMTTSYLQYVEEQGGQPSAGVARRLAEALHTTVEYLYGEGTLEPGARLSPHQDLAVTSRTTAPVVTHLSRQDCLLLMGSVPIGRVAFVASGPPLVLPVNFTLMGHDIVIQTSAMSHLAELARAGRLVSFEVDDVDEPSRLGWSVLCHGPARISTEDGLHDQVARHLVQSWFGDDRHTVVVITPAEMTGRRIGLA
jgi:nitroimidazol reductase NimA-like FMN-containing flavoprotein (pyridoxamine 5'-phosphate oxidase superfamily)/DNA-binding XRE family transcriptional regulator